MGSQSIGGGSVRLFPCCDEASVVMDAIGVSNFYKEN